MKWIFDFTSTDLTGFKNLLGLTTSASMKTISCKQLRQIIADVLSVSIDEIRATKDNQFFYEYDMPPIDNEVDEFIISSSCFDDEMKKWLLGEVSSIELVSSRGFLNLT